MLSASELQGLADVKKRLDWETQFIDLFKSM